MNRLITIFALLIVLVCTGAGQRLITVQPGDDAIAQAINSDSTARKAALPTQTIYVLKRDGIYPLISVIDANFFLYIKAEAGTGYKPYLISKENSANALAQIINLRAGGRFEGLTIEQRSLNGNVGNRRINLYNGSSLWVKDCEIVHDRGSALTLQSDSCSIYVEDCFIHSHGHPKSLGGNGRLVDVRSAAYTDSIVIRNTTFFDLTDRIIRNMTNFVNYLEFDHNTGFTNQGYHGGLQGGKVKEMKITNNIFYNQLAYGASFRRVAGYFPTNISEQTQPENNQMWVVTIDTTYKYPVRNIVVRNNNVWWDQAYKDLWVKWKDSTKAPGIFTPTLMKLTADSTKAYFTEPLTFQKLPPSIFTFIDSAIGFPNSAILPDNWCWTYQDANGQGPINGSYGTTAQSYTKGDGGFPLGDLNWYPARKTAWLAFVSDVNDNRSGAIPAEFSLSQNYPNPFNPSTNITFNLPKSGKVTLKVFNTLGQQVATLVDGDYVAGMHTMNFDASSLSSGVYIYTLSAGDFLAAKKMILLK
ncbi:MAG: T9SS type A sorting domain-containing protein [Ignavibacteriales bacterium]|nr:T9SS type A sorting domain-containing protein [Ignavibacteriales bacterium]